MKRSKNRLREPAQKRARLMSAGFLANIKDSKGKSVHFGGLNGSLQRYKQKQPDAMQTPELSEVSMGLATS